MNALVLTWPKKRTLKSYLDALEDAKANSEAICFRVAHRPKKVKEGDRCYMVHDGYMRGWLTVLGISDTPRLKVTDPVTGKRMADGLYIVRDPEWHPIEPKPMKGFRGFRYIDG